MDGKYWKKVRWGRRGVMRRGGKQRQIFIIVLERFRKILEIYRKILEIYRKVLESVRTLSIE